MRAREFLPLVEASYGVMVDAMHKKYPAKSDDIDSAVNWAEKTLKRPDAVFWYLKILKAYLEGSFQGNFQEVGNDVAHFLGFQHIPGIQNYKFNDQPVAKVLADLDRIEKEYQKRQQELSPVTPKPGDHRLIEFDDGSAWWWVDRAYCPEEGRSGQHCGNVMGQYHPNTTQRILSYRDQEGHVILTFILLQDGTLGEMKAKNNQKPDRKYHPVIMKLLMSNRITGIAPTRGQYAPHMNFSVFDLDEPQLHQIDQQKPQLITTQIQAIPTSVLGAPDWIKQKYQNQVPDTVRGLLFDVSSEAWEQAIQQDPELIIYAPDTLEKWQDRVVQTIARSNRGQLLLRAPAGISRNSKIIAEILQANPEAIAAVNPNLKDYRRLCLIAVRQDGRALQYVPQEPKNLRDRDMCLTAVQQNGRALQYVPQEPKNLRDRDMCLTAVQQNGRALEYVPRELRDREMCLTAVRQNGQALYYVPEEPENLRDREMYLAAVGQNGLILDYVPEELRDRKMCLTAVRKHAGALKYVPPELRKLGMYLAAVRKNRDALQYVPLAYQSKVYDQLIVDTYVAAVRQSPEFLEHVPLDYRQKVQDRLEKDPEFKKTRG